ncbi:MAG: ABC transporter ATP-binding protein [Candidatus Odinarchaeota archaeon]|nr:ABC transporter ATP-binding protein [Candidatus Odinarchaeota archaeon]
MTQIKLSNVSKVYRIEKRYIHAIRDVSLKIEQGEFIVLFGPSGSGKTTLLLLLGAIIKPTKGKILYDKVDITKFSEDEAAKWRHNNIGFIFQKINLIEFLNVLENVTLPMYPYADDFETVKNKALELIETVGLTERLRHKPSQLSVGEQQRVAIARALINNPKIVLADEPTAHLDTNTGRGIIKLMKKLRDLYHVTFIISTHDPEIITIADRIIKIRDGKIISDSKI